MRGPACLRRRRVLMQKGGGETMQRGEESDLPESRAAHGRSRAGEAGGTDRLRGRTEGARSLARARARPRA